MFYQVASGEDRIPLNDVIVAFDVELVVSTLVTEFVNVVFDDESHVTKSQINEIPYDDKIM